ncbi:hypothetical protein ACHWQZ_G009725 [Mnemiopsis leidyi]
MTLRTVLILVVLLTCFHLNNGVGELQFSLWESDTQRSHEGLLLVSINGGPRKNVCRLKGDVFWYPDYQSSRYICQRLGFHHVVNTFSVEGRFPFRLHYRPGIYKLECQNTTSCTYLDIEDRCKDLHYTYLACECNGDFYTTPYGCVPCPADSGGVSEPVHRCSCAAGLYWDSSTCEPCPAFTYSPTNSTECEQCPDGATSRPGSASCDCFPGLYKMGEVCVECEGNTFSKTGSFSCTDCPTDSTVSSDHTYCTCNNGALWDSLRNLCPLQNTSDGHHSRTEAYLAVVIVLTALILVFVLAGFGFFTFLTLRRKKKEDSVVVMNRFNVPPPVPQGPPPNCEEGLEDDTSSERYVTTSGFQIME